MTKKWFVAFDYGQLEARLIGMASKDTTFVKACLEGFDIHRYWSKQFLNAYPKLIGKAKKSLITDKDIKIFRAAAKNKVVFPWIYDSSPYSTAKLLNMPSDITKHLYEEFWNMFSGIKTWKKSVHKAYEKNNYVTTLIGSRRQGPLSFTKRVNTIIQGTGGYITMGAMNRLSEKAYELDKAQYQACLNIHDDLSFGLRDISLEADIEFIAKEMCRKTHAFMGDTPLQVEVQIGKNWADLQEIAVFDTRDFNY